jgi:hypothetical protein
MGERSGEAGGEGVRDDLWAWERERAKVAAKFDDDELREVIESVTWVNFEGHAYSDKDLQDLRKILRLSEDDWPDDVLHRHTDEVVALIGLALFVARKDTGKNNVKRLENKLLSPAQKFLSALENPEFQLEFLQPWTPMKFNEKDELASSVRDFVEKLNDHIVRIRQSSKKGQSWDSELKDQFLQYVDILCEFLNPEIEPKRSVNEGDEDHSQFGQCVYLLARTLKWGAEKGKDIKFDGAIRKYVNMWHAALLKTAQELENERYGLEGKKIDPFSSM